MCEITVPKFFRLKWKVAWHFAHIFEDVRNLKITSNIVLQTSEPYVLVEKMSDPT